MPFYYPLWNKARVDLATRRRTASTLARLRSLLEAEVPSRTLNETLLLATWNIREFDSPKFSWRNLEAYYYIAEVIERFDLVAIQEVNDDLTALRQLVELLGGWWKFIVTDTTEGSSGNRERMAFLFDSRKVAFDGIAGEIVLPQARNAKAFQFARTPFMCGFKAGWAKFTLCTAHIYYGKGVPNDERRVREIDALAAFFKKRARRDARRGGARDPSIRIPPYRAFENLILLGDFNIFRREDATMAALRRHGFQVPEQLLRLNGSNVERNKHYDQIAFMKRDDRFEGTGKAGIIDLYKVLYRAGASQVEGDESAYRPLMKRSWKFKEWRTHQLSDHLPMWVELKINFTPAYLDELIHAK